MLTPVTRSNSGRLPRAVQPASTPAPKAPSAPPPEIARKLTTGRPFSLGNCRWEARTCAHFSLAMASTLGGGTSPQKRMFSPPMPTTVASLSNPNGTGLRGSDAQAARLNATAPYQKRRRSPRTRTKIPHRLGTQKQSVSLSGKRPLCGGSSKGKNGQPPVAKAFTAWRRPSAKLSPERSSRSCARSFRCASRGPSETPCRRD